jgi:hypothetical protein
MARIDIEIEEYLDEVRTEYLVDELLRRKDAIQKLLEHKELKITNINEIIIPEFKTSDDVLNHLKLILRLKSWHDKKRIITEIENL